MNSTYSTQASLWWASQHRCLCTKSRWARTGPSKSTFERGPWRTTTPVDFRQLLSRIKRDGAIYLLNISQLITKTNDKNVRYTDLFCSLHTHLGDTTVALVKKLLKRSILFLKRQGLGMSSTRTSVPVSSHVIKML